MLLLDQINYFWPNIKNVGKKNLLIFTVASLLGILTVNFSLNWIQEPLLCIRRNCTCDSVRILSYFQSAELLSMVVTPNMYHRLVYFWCRYVCALLP